MHYLQRKVRERINNLETFKPENCYVLGNILCDGLLTGGWVCCDTVPYGWVGLLFVFTSSSRDEINHPCYSSDVVPRCFGI